VGDTNHCEHHPVATLASIVPDQLVRRHSMPNGEECLENWFSVRVARGMISKPC